MEISKKIVLENRIIIIDGEERSSMEIILKTKNGSFHLPILPPMRIQNKEDGSIMVNRKIKRWTKEELEKVLDDELENIFNVSIIWKR